MRVFSRTFRSPLAVLLPLLLLAATSAWAAPARVQLQVTGYVINADLYPADNKLSATAQVTFTALEDVSTPTFELNNGLQLTKVTGADKKPLNGERVTTNSTVRFALDNPIPKGTSTTWTFEYTGTLKGAETSPVEGINFASVEDPISILLYPGRWFPMVGLYTNRFTSEMHIRVPSDERVVGSGS
ncbi:MAG TPA: peptidase M1, partial [Edaphobacter sp.]